MAQPEKLVFASYADRHRFTLGALDALVQYLDDSALLFKHLEQCTHPLGVGEVGLRDNVGSALDENVRLVSILQALAAKHHRVAKEFVVERFLFGHPP